MSKKMSKQEKLKPAAGKVTEEVAEKIPLKEKVRGLKKHWTRRNIVIGVIGLLFLIQFIQVQRVFGTFSFLEWKDSSLITEVGQIKESYTKIGTDLNEVRNFLRLPTSSYATIDEAGETEADEDKNQDDLQLALFKYVDFLAKEKTATAQRELKMGFLEKLFTDQPFQQVLAEQKLQMSMIESNADASFLTINFEEGGEFVTYYLSKESGNLYRKTILEKTEITSETTEDFMKEVTEFVKANRKNIAENIQEIANKNTLIVANISKTEVTAEAQKLGVTITTVPLTQDAKSIYAIKNKSNEEIGQIVLDHKNGDISLVDLNDPSVTVKVSDSMDLVSFLQKLDTKTFLEKKVAAAKASIEKTLNDEGFKLLLKQSGLSINEKAEEDEDRFYYYLIDEKGAKLGAIAIEKSTGVVNIVRPDGTNAENILFFDPEDKKKTLDLPSNIPEYSDNLSHEDDTFNILIAGKHGSLVDTMIFAHIDELKGEIRMISVPRDLFYNGRKINAYASSYGLPELKRVLSEISGYELDKYISIDMYAFIDVIDLIGGIDVHLDNAVIDPTYRTVDDGVEGTLHYEPGDYHLGGKEALRLARTRHTSSDFARASRQQMILEALQDKARNFGFGDADTIYEIVKTVLAKTETDIGFDEAILYYFRYQNYEIVSNAVMSSGNVLYVPPYITKENCEKLIEEAAAAGQEEPGCMDENQAYTLLPRNNNWNVVKWFFRQEFEAVE